MTENKEIKKKKGKSLSAQLVSLRERLKYAENSFYEYRVQIGDLRNQLSRMKALLPLKYYKIKFKIKAQNDLVYEYTEIIEEFIAQLAIEKLLRNKMHPDTFELLDITCLA